MSGKAQVELAVLTHPCHKYVPFEPGALQDMRGIRNSGTVCKEQNRCLANIMESNES